MMAIPDQKTRISILGRKIRDKWDGKKKKFVHLYEIIFDPEVLVFACSDVAKLKGASKKNGISTNLNGISFLKVKSILKHVLKRSWVVSPVKKVFIFKKKFVEARTLKILSLYDKIIATAIQMVLSLIFEKHDSLNFLKVNRYFFKDNHGFRPGKSCHTALNKIITWKVTKWFVFGDIYECFESINQKRLISIINKSIEDPFLIDILHKFFNTFLDKKDLVNSEMSKEVKVPYGHSFFLLLMNIYLNELDQFILLLKKEIGNKFFLLQNTKRFNKPSKFEFDKNLWNNEYQQVYYVRYSDYYLIGIKGIKKIAKMIKERSENFLKLILGLKIRERTLIHTKNNKVTFLGFDIKVVGRKDRAIIGARKILSFKKIRNKILINKNAMETRFEKAVAKEYEVNKLKTLKALLKNKNINCTRDSLIRTLAVLDAKELVKTTTLKSLKWLHDQEPFDTWMKREYTYLQQSWIKKVELEELGLNKIINAYNNLLRVLQKEIIEEKNKIKPIVTQVKFFQKKMNRVYLSESRNFQTCLYASIYKLKNKLKMWHIISKSGKPQACGFAIKYKDTSIIEFFKQKALGFLNYYKPAFNFYEIKRLVNYHLRWSLIHTLAAKYSTKVHKIVSKYGKTPNVILVYGKKQKILAEFLTPNDINNRSWGFLIPNG